MTLSDLASIGSLVSGLAVLVSLVYLNIQTRQSSKHTRALIQQGRSALWAELPLRYAQDPVLSDLRLRADIDALALDRTEIFRYRQSMFSDFYFWEDQFYQRRDGLLDDDRFAGTARVIEIRFHSPAVRHSWKQARNAFGKDYQSFMDDILRRTPVTARRADPLEAWKAGIEAELGA